MADKVQQFAENGVHISKSPVYVGDEITITYDGLLAKSGADTVYIHMGYGADWNDKEFLLMEAEGGAFRATLKVSMSGTLNVAFKDSAENWDNNSSDNYSYKVVKKAIRASKTSDTRTSEKAVVKKASAKSKATVEKETAGRRKSTAKASVSRKSVKKAEK